MSESNVSAVVESTRAYYDGPADEIYRSIWKDNLHLGVPCDDNCAHPEAMVHTNEIMAQAVDLGEGTRVLDAGCGYGSTARYLGAKYGCTVVGINISEKELELAKQRTASDELSHLCSFEWGDFHDLRFDDCSFDVVWSQEAYLHAADKSKVVKESYRVTKPGGYFIFTDVLVREGTPQADRDRIYERVKSLDMWDLLNYIDSLHDHGYDLQRVENWSQHVARSYGWVRDQLVENHSELAQRVDVKELDKVVDAYNFWVESAIEGKIGWGLFVAQRPIETRFVI